MKYVMPMGVTVELAMKVIRVNPYWKRPYLWRQLLHIMGVAPYQDRKLPYHKRVIIVPVVKALYAIKKFKENYDNGRCIQNHNRTTGSD